MKYYLCIELKERSYMSRIKRYGNESKDYVIWFTLSNGKTLLTPEGFVFLQIN